jgi:hypothetical protein
MIPVVPNPLPSRFIISADMYITEMKLDEYAIFCVSLYDDSTPKFLVERVYVKIEGDDYKNWGEDDTYIKRIVLSKLNLEMVTEQNT